jgi:transposase InsO family protein
MPWNVSGIVKQRKGFLEALESGYYTMKECCERYGISRQAGYKVLGKYREYGEAGLVENSRAPHNHPNQTPVEMEEQILELRRAHMRWGPRTLQERLRRNHPEVVWPAVSTIGAILKREGLVIARRKRRRVPPYTQPFASVTAPNVVWCADFKGWIRTGDGDRIDPLTITDANSRYLLRCQSVEKANTEHVLAVFEAVFREHGLPQAIRTDNGAPFASRAVAGLSQLAVYWMKLGIVPERIQAGHPEQNGRHERMHRTLKETTAQPPAAHRRAQQRRFDDFVQEYNQERPHQALDMRTPAECYQSSPRPYPARVPEPQYPQAMRVRTVYKGGQFFWNYHDVFLSKVLAGERIGLLPIDERYWKIYFAEFPIARLDSHKLHVESLKQDDLSDEL